MRSYSQNQEDLTILSYFNGKTGTLLSIGENDGSTFSNARLLIEHGFSAHLIEPGSTFQQLEALHKGNERVNCYNFAIGSKFVDAMTFYESAAHVIGGADRGLVSSLDFDETERWRKSGVEFTEKQVKVVDFGKFWWLAGEPMFDFVSIDCEGYDFDILQQIDLDKVGCRAICVEWNGDFALKVKIEGYILPFGFKLIERNRENLIFVK